MATLLLLVTSPANLISDLGWTDPNPAGFMGFFTFANLPLLFASQFWILAGLVAIVVISLVTLHLLKTNQRLPYEKIGGLCTKTELKFYEQLLPIVADRFQIFAKVRIADLLSVKKGEKNYLSWFNKINCKHIDFVLCDPKTLNVLAAIELDDPTHDRADRVERDRFVNLAFEHAELPILRIRTRAVYDARAISGILATALGGNNRTWVYHVH